ncbi:MAG: holo-ACP synthase [Chloroflexi bacterium]|nr:holo-ACP synthase [Chloroflexota bacterium]
MLAFPRLANPRPAEGGGKGAGNRVVFVGVDIIEIERIEATYARYGERFLSRVYTPAERVYCRGRGPQLASRFAAKEAVMKLLGTGVRGVAWREIEVVRQRGRAPEVVLHDRAAAVAARLGIVRIAISLAHSKQYAVASCVGETKSA